LFAGDVKLDFNIHCTGDASITGHISASGYEKRRSFEANSWSIREITMPTKQDAPLVVLFLGAGASTVEGLPTGNDLRNRALARFVEFTVDPSNYVEAARLFYKQLESAGDRLRPSEISAGEDSFVQSLTLERVLLEEQALEHKPDCRTIREFAAEHRDMALALAEARAAGKFADDPLTKLLALRRRLVLITVNFDRVIEIKAGDDVRPYSNESELDKLPQELAEYAANGGPVPLIKLHGDIETPASMVVSIQDTESGLSTARLGAMNAVLSKFRQQANRPWWYVGYSMRDLDLKAIWQSPDFMDGLAEHWVSPFRDPAVCSFIATSRQARWDTEGLGYSASNRIVTLTAADFFQMLWGKVAQIW
jgi:hypothetical protein